MEPIGYKIMIREGKEVKFRVCYRMYDGYYEMFFSEDQKNDAFWFADWLRTHKDTYHNVEIIEVEQ